jgi:GTP pyrophosphokinase
MIETATAELYRKVRDGKHAMDLEFIQQVLEFAVSSHDGQLRLSGEPYVLHPISVASILSELGMDTTSLAAALLHDVIEDSRIPYEEILVRFGKEVADLVEGVTKLSAISSSKEERDARNLPTMANRDAQAENLRKIFLSMARDIRVILVKLADRLHNLRTLSSLQEHRRKFIARESLEIFAPISSRLGLWRIKSEMEDLAFKYLEPEAYEELVEAVKARRAEREEDIKEVIEALRGRLREQGFEFHIDGRPKHFYSIYQKMNKKNKGFDEVYDLIAVRVIVDTVEECYAALGAVHSLWRPLPERIKDFIASPKTNNYRSLHTTVFGPGDKPIEIQIRTWEMHRVNEFGIAAHWAYKEGTKDLELIKDILPWVQRVLEWQADSQDAREYVESLKLDLLQYQVFVFTPHGDVIDLPAGSTALDFAYRVHTEVGNHFTGAKVNGRIVPLDYELQNGEILEIITSKHSTPSRDWLKICKSSHARNKIKNWFKRASRDENITRGRDMLERELKRNRLEDLGRDEKFLGQLSEELNFFEKGDLLASIGYGGTSLTHVLNKIRLMKPKEEDKAVPEPLPSKPARRKTSKQAVIIKGGLDNLLTKFAKCCYPVPGDEIFGYVTQGKGISIHRTGCPNYATLNAQKERIIEVEWGSPRKDVCYPVDLELDAFDRVGLVSDIMNAVNELKVPAVSCNARRLRQDRAKVKLALEICERQQLDDLIKKLENLSGVYEVSRATHMGAG